MGHLISGGAAQPVTSPHSWQVTDAIAQPARAVERSVHFTRRTVLTSACSCVCACAIYRCQRAVVVTALTPTLQDAGAKCFCGVVPACEPYSPPSSVVSISLRCMHVCSAPECCSVACDVRLFVVCDCGCGRILGRIVWRRLRFGLCLGL